MTSTVPDRLNPDKAPLVEGIGTRCMWVREKNPETGEEWLEFLPGCSTMMFGPESGECMCDTIAYRYNLQVEQRRDCDDQIGWQRRQIRRWFDAGVAAYNALTGEQRTNIHPQELARAVAKRGAR